MSFTKYLKAAFLNHWNLLAFLSGSAFAMISGRADALLPIVAACEIGYLGLLGSHPKFQQYVEAQEAKAGRDQASQAGQQSLEHILRTLPRELAMRFQTLRGHCLELRQIAMELKRPGMAAGPQPLEDLQLAGLDRLLWIHLRLLYTKYSLAQFLQRTSADQIQKDLEKTGQRLQQIPADQADPRRQRMRAVLEDNLRTSRQRLDNLNRARDDYQMIDVEIEGLESKIRSLSEMAVNRPDAEFFTSEVDHVSASMVDTERRMNELQFATGFGELENEPPELLRAKTLTERK